jgi:hypothetical protein
MQVPPQKSVPQTAALLYGSPPNGRREEIRRGHWRFQVILRHYPEEKEPYNQIIWIANLTGQFALAETFSKKFQEFFA